MLMGNIRSPQNRFEYVLKNIFFSLLFEDEQKPEQLSTRKSYSLRFLPSVSFHSHAHLRQVPSLFASRMYIGCTWKCKQGPAPATSRDLLTDS